MKEKFESKESINEKERRWKEIRAEVESVADKLGMPVDEKIKLPVVGLMANGFKTTMSCEGHLDHGIPWPWIEIESSLASDIKKNQSFRLLDDAASLKDGWKSMSKKEKTEWETYKSAIDEANKKDTEKLRKIISDFYEEEDDDRPERVNVSRWGSVEPKVISDLRAQVKGEILDVHKTWPAKEKKTNLELYQKEFQRFADFLKERFFSEK